MPSLELELENDNELIGNVMLTRQVIYGKGKESYSLLVATFFCVKKEYCNQKIGAMLIEEVSKQAF